MSKEKKEKRLRLWTPASYRIQVEGELNESWSDHLGGMRVTTHKREDQSIVTTLTGRVMDQAELEGILNSLYELPLPILSIENLMEENNEGAHALVKSSSSEHAEEGSKR